MPGKLSKRKRLMLITILVSMMVLVIILAAVWWTSKAEAPYRPGEDIEGITSKLSRSLPQDYPKITFVDAASEAGISFQHFSGKRTSQLPEDMGSGAAWGDYDNDGWLDLFVANLAGPLTLSKEEVQQSPARCALYHNNGDGTFTDVAEIVGLDFRGWVNAAAWGDYNNDGLLDIFLSCYGENVFYKNNGDPRGAGITFSDVTRESGLGDINGFWTGASWADFNKDGFLDLYVCGYVKYAYEDPSKVALQYDVEVPANINPSSFEPDRNLLYRNNGRGQFHEIAQTAGVDNLQGRSLSASWCDFDEDGWPDLYVANDVSDNALYRNSGNGTFEDISHAAFVADYRGAMGIAVGDWDMDEDMDMFITHWIAQENALYNNLRSQISSLKIKTASAVEFMDEADRYGLGQIALDYIGWGTFFFDYNNDGRLDLFVTNGSTFQQKEKPWLLEPMPDQLYWNQGSEKGFYDVSLVSGEIFQKRLVGRGAAFADYDNDGDVDIALINHGDKALLLRNDGGNANNWLKIKLEGITNNRLAIGARLRLVVGKNVHLRQIGTQSSYCSQNSLIAHFGLGNSSRADTLSIIWPSGVQETLFDLPANQLIKVVEGKNNRFSRRSSK